MNHPTGATDDRVAISQALLPPTLLEFYWAGPSRTLLGYWAAPFVLGYCRSLGSGVVCVLLACLSAGVAQVLFFLSSVSATRHSYFPHARQSMPLATVLALT